MNDAEFVERCRELLNERVVPGPDMLLDSAWSGLPEEVIACLWREHLRGWLWENDKITVQRDFRDGEWIVWEPEQGGTVMLCHGKTENEALLAAVEAVVKEKNDGA